MTINNFEDKIKPIAKEMATFLAAELRLLDFNVGNLELYPVCEKFFQGIGSDIYRLGLTDAMRVFTKFSERLDEDIYVLENQSKIGSLIKK